jgi:protein phosphatase
LQFFVLVVLSVLFILFRVYIMEYAARTDIGKVRDLNEDAFLAEGNLFAVADGMGGHKAGEIASAMAIDNLKEIFDTQKPGSDPAEIRRALKTAASSINKKLFFAAARKKAYAGMGTTLTAAYFDNCAIYLAHVGDSRAFLLRDGELAQMTLDHTLVNEMIERGEIDEELARIHPLRHVITRAMGTFSEVKADIMEIPVRPGDVILLCSDGLASKVPVDLAGSIIVESPDLDAAADRLVKAALSAGGEDNITLVLARVTEEDCV